MTIQNFEDVIAWQKARILTKDVYAAFGQHRDFGIRDQILRASVSIMNNIAEGFDRQRSAELRHFLLIARGSAAEVRSMLILASDLGYLSESEKDMLTLQAKEVSKLLTGFMKHLGTGH